YTRSAVSLTFSQPLESADPLVEMAPLARLPTVFRRSAPSSGSSRYISPAPMARPPRMERPLIMPVRHESSVERISICRSCDLLLVDPQSMLLLLCHFIALLCAGQGSMMHAFVSTMTVEYVFRLRAAISGVDG